VRIVAVDWSGRLHGERRAIWVAEARDGVLVRLECGRDRDEVGEHLVELAAADAGLVVGLDCSFSFPAWFLAERGYATVEQLWDAAADDGERWLAECSPPFWGRPGRPRPELPAHLRVTEASVPVVGGVRPKSTFQVGGAGSVGTGSIRGFPVLARLARAGFAVWPFHAARLPLVVEVWPRACTGAVVKSDETARATLLDARSPQLRPELRAAAVASDDAFDAAVTALEMAAHAGDFTSLPMPPHPAARLEGWVWLPQAPAASSRPTDASIRLGTRSGGRSEVA
jgi:hypothetical protein